ncbi:MAG: Hyi family protein [Rhodospirillales bacterium]|jgi:hydroxypyruvate isomerase|nr:Hyi family protein [Rhodospirillales bacterium]
MPKFSANLTFLFPDLPFLDRFAAAANAGFEAVEFAFAYDHAPAEIADRLKSHGLTLALFNLPPGDRSGDRGLAALPGREAEFRAALARALVLARATGCKRLHVMAGTYPADADRALGEAVYVENLRTAADAMAAEGITLLIEPLNTRDNPAYFLTTTGQAIAMLDRVERDNARLQLDLYHCQIMEGDLANHIERLLPRTGHVQIAGNPGRHEPDRGEVNYPFLFELLDDLGYDGWVGCEYRPHGGTLDGLGWARRFGIGA